MNSQGAALERGRRLDVVEVFLVVVMAPTGGDIRMILRADRLGAVYSDDAIHTTFAPRA